MNKNYYILTNLLSEEETGIITSIINHIERGEGRVGIHQIANENFVSSTFIIKMCQRLGFDGYSELYYHLSQRVNAGSQEAGHEALAGLIDNYDEEKGRTFCRLLSKYQDEKMFVEGNGFSDLVAEYIVQRLSVCGFMVFNRVHFYDFMIFHEDQKGLETNIKPSLMIAISQSGETAPVINDVKNAKQKGYEIVSFTRKADSTLAKLSDLTFIVDGAKQTLIGGVPNPFFGKIILAFEELMGKFLHNSVISKKENSN